MSTILTICVSSGHSLLTCLGVFECAVSYLETQLRMIHQKPQHKAGGGGAVTLWFNHRLPFRGAWVRWELISFARVIPIKGKQIVFYILFRMK